MKNKIITDKQTELSDIANTITLLLLAPKNMINLINESEIGEKLHICQDSIEVRRYTFIYSLIFYMYQKLGIDFQKYSINELAIKSANLFGYTGKKRDSYISDISKPMSSENYKEVTERAKELVEIYNNI